MGGQWCPLSIGLRGYSTSNHQFISFSSCDLCALGTHPHQRWVTSRWLTTFIKGWYSIQFSACSTSNHSFMRRELHQVRWKKDMFSNKKISIKIRSTYDNMFLWQVDHTFGFLQSNIHECLCFSARINLYLKEGHQNNENKVCSWSCKFILQRQESFQKGESLANKNKKLNAAGWPCSSKAILMTNLIEPWLQVHPMVARENLEQNNTAVNSKVFL